MKRKNKNFSVTFIEKTFISEKLRLQVNLLHLKNKLCFPFIFQRGNKTHSTGGTSLKKLRPRQLSDI
jgi:hypothetical protein